MHSTDLMTVAAIVLFCLLLVALAVLTVYRRTPGLYRALFAVTAVGTVAMTYAADGLGWAVGVASCFNALYITMWRPVVKLIGATPTR